MNLRFRLTALIVLISASSLLAADAGFTLTRTPSGGVEVKVDGKPFATYVIDQGNKPFLWPIYGPTGKPMTRAYPMEQVEGEQHDHIHQRGLTFGHEGINDTDTWQEKATYEEMLKSPKTEATGRKRIVRVGAEKHRDFTELKAEGDHASIVETLDYVDPKGKRLLTEERRITFHLIGDMRAIDFDQDLIASDGPVTFADAKDAGLEIRVPTSMAVDSKKGGHIIDSKGLENEKAWAQRADWCEYDGPVDGEKLGIAFFDHPSSYNHPTPWHVRTYGLFAANMFGSKSLDKKAPEHVTQIAAGDRLKLRHRLLFHTGDEKSAKIAEAYEAYAKEQR
ncbi:MAG TPA: PmoA family protein [Tepidisphaeraceae bacterium]|nr:PmoA family protein [Tepidisphaeraceae bacterium]